MSACGGSGPLQTSIHPQSGPPLDGGSDEDPAFDNFAALTLSDVDPKEITVNEATIRAEVLEEILAEIVGNFDPCNPMIENYRKAFEIAEQFLGVASTNNLLFTLKKFVDIPCKELAKKKPMTRNELDFDLPTYSTSLQTLESKLRFIENCKVAGKNPCEVIKFLRRSEENDLFEALLHIVRGEVYPLFAAILDRNHVKKALKFLRQQQQNPHLRLRLFGDVGSVLHLLLSRMSIPVQDRLLLTQELLKRDPFLAQIGVNNLGKLTSIWTAEDGQLPLQLELYNKKVCVDIVKVLLEAFPGALSSGEAYLLNSHMRSLYEPLVDGKRVKDVILQGREDTMIEKILEEVDEKLQEAASASAGTRVHGRTFEERYYEALQYEAFQACFEVSAASNEICLMGFPNRFVTVYSFISYIKIYMHTILL